MLVGINLLKKTTLKVLFLIITIPIQKKEKGKLISIISNIIN